MMPIKVYILVGARPNFIKVTQFKKCAAARFQDLSISIIHTGQHYDEKMTTVFFEQLDFHPDHYLGIAPGSPVAQIAGIMTGLERLFDKIGDPDLILVVGDVNSALAGALFANKRGIRLGHIESGLRSKDPSMPEEHNRIIVDYLSDIYFITEPSGEQHLKLEHRAPSKMNFVGNTMIDTLVAFEKEIDASAILKTLGLGEEKFVLMTMHRPSTVDNKEGFTKLIELINRISRKYKIVFPVHPRTVKKAREFNLMGEIEGNKNLVCTEPLDYFAFQKLVKCCFFILTDSGGIQEESTFMRKPCLTLRSSTERPVTVTVGTNTLMSFDLTLVQQHIDQIENGSYKKGMIPEFWDGKATDRILKIIASGL